MEDLYVKPHKCEGLKYLHGEEQCPLPVYKVCLASKPVALEPICDSESTLVSTLALGTGCVMCFGTATSREGWEEPVVL